MKFNNIYHKILISKGVIYESIIEGYNVPEIGIHPFGPHNLAILRHRLKSPSVTLNMALAYW